LSQQARAALISIHDVECFRSDTDDGNTDHGNTDDGNALFVLGRHDSSPLARAEHGHHPIRGHRWSRLPFLFCASNFLAMAVGCHYVLLAQIRTCLWPCVDR